MLLYPASLIMEKPRFLNFHEERVYATKPREASSAVDVCTHLSLGVCPCTKPKKHASASSTTKKRQLCDDRSSKKAPTTAARKRACNHNVERRRWGYSLELVLYDDPWKIKKVLQDSDLGNMSRLLVAKELAENLVLPVLGADAQRDAETARGTNVRIWDVDTNSKHSLVFKRWASSRSYIFTSRWVQDFVKRRGLKRGDEIGLHWDPYKNHFDFSVLHQAI